MNLIDLLPIEWREFLGISNGYFHGIESAIGQDSINPEIKNIFKAFQILPSDVKVVIVGQDPYPNSEDAVGLAFSVHANRNVLPASLRNIRKELDSDLNIPFESKGDLTPWVAQGVLLLNRILTTRSGESLAHKGIGWEEFTDLVISKLANRNVIFILWGNSAQSLSKFIPIEKQIVGVHPSPLSASRGFFGSKPFSEVNRKLELFGLTPINWKI
jgi:uracil-DNA glycosylase